MKIDDEHRATEAEPSADIASCVFRVTNLERSLQFYCDVFSCEIAIREIGMALVLTPKGFQIYLHEVGGLRRRGAVGIQSTQYVMWVTDSKSELKRVTDRMRAYDTAVYEYSPNGLEIVEGSDPDGRRVIVAYPSQGRLPRMVVAERLRH